MDGVKMAICGYESLYFCKRHCRKGEARFAGKGGFPCRTHIDHADVPCKYHVKRLLAALLESEEYMKDLCSHAMPDANDDMSVFYHCDNPSYPEDGFKYVDCLCLSPQGVGCLIATLEREE